MSPGDLKYSVYNLLPIAVRVQGRSFFRNYLLDLSDRLRGRDDRKIPPRHLNISGEGPFRAYGRNTVDLCRKYGGLQATDAVLDVGCGIGRTALALTEFLRTPGLYAGFDIIQFAIAWCRENIESSHPNFSFTHADVQNRTYNPGGRIAADQYHFPYRDQTFSFALATSVFTHLMPAAAERYVAETARVMNTDGRFLSTWFLLDERSDSVLSRERFPHRFQTHSQANLQAPEQAVAFQTDHVKSLFEASGFTVEGMYRGDWSGAAERIESMQDVIVVRRIR